MAAWDETKPAGTDAISSGDDSIRTLKTDIRERLDNEHTWTATGDNTEGKHNEGSARITTDTSAPADVLDGRLYYDTANKLLKFANGSAFANMDLDAAQILAILGYKLVTSTAAVASSGSYATYVAGSITKKEASSLLVVFGKLNFHPSSSNNSSCTIGIANVSSIVSDSEQTCPAVSAGFVYCVNTFTVISGVAADAQTINLQFKRTASFNEVTTDSGSLLIFEIRNPFTL